MSKTENEQHVDRVLNQISTRLDSLTVSAPKLSDPAHLRTQMLRLLAESGDQEITAAGLTQRLADDDKLIGALGQQMANLNALIAEGKACLRSGEPVRAECGMAPALLPEVQSELAAAQQASAATRSELSACRNKITLLNANVTRLADDAYLASLLGYVGTLLRESMDLAALAGSKVTSGAATVAVDRRIMLLLQNQGMVLALKNHQGRTSS
ncbi:hypothetical protein MUU47_00425 [Scandinavium sp. H11S7]|uniref:Uncharacterized protein n=1 Tax=Scandinavium hiltneri TaxID=2926519 RepID=A0ABT2DVH9_9ENTR|nr:hypothetical protein [Scandinavium hiltneri]MCS2159629.1 hypothetical protein [Scandinavium hiltneri]